VAPFVIRSLLISSPRITKSHGPSGVTVILFKTTSIGFKGSRVKGFQ
jgi:hypothetical protein